MRLLWAREALLLGCDARLATGRMQGCLCRGLLWAGGWGGGGGQYSAEGKRVIDGAITDAAG